MSNRTDQTPIDQAAAFADAVPPGCAIATMGITPTWVNGGTAHAELLVDDYHLNQVGVVQGGVYSLFADATAGWAAMSALRPGKTFVTLEMRVNLLRAVRAGTRLIAEAKPVHLGGTTFVFGVTVYAEGRTPERPSAYFVCTQLVLDEA